MNNKGQTCIIRDRLIIGRQRYVFLTTEMTLAPGITAFLYKIRWDIEKLFNQSKNKFGEKKGWAKSEDSK